MEFQDIEDFLSEKEHKHLSEQGGDRKSVSSIKPPTSMEVEICDPTLHPKSEINEHISLDIRNTT